MIYMTAALALVTIAFVVVVLRLLADKARVEAAADRREQELRDRLLVLSDPNRYMTYHSMNDDSPPAKAAYVDEEKGYELEQNETT